MNYLCICMRAAFILLLFSAICSGETFHAMPGGLKYKDLKIGSGEETHTGSTAVIHITGWLDENGQRGKEIYNSRKEGRPISFVVGTSSVMRGWNQGIVGMKAGGSRLLMVPPELGFGAKAVEDLIPPHAHLIFIIELLEVK